MDYTGTLRPKGVTFADLRYLKRVGISQVEVHERVGKSVIGGQKGPKGPTDVFYGYEKVEKTFWFCDLFIFKKQCIYSSY